MLPTGYNYRPLPDGLTIKKSDIEGLGLYTEKSIPAKTELGYTHIRDKRFDRSLIRTPLGGFINHSDTPNCELIQKGDSHHLCTLDKISKNTEITVNYNLSIK